jgi:hypothetical protein
VTHSAGDLGQLLLDGVGCNDSLRKPAAVDRAAASAKAQAWIAKLRQYRLLDPDRASASGRRLDGPAASKAPGVSANVLRCECSVERRGADSGRWPSAARSALYVFSQKAICSFLVRLFTSVTAIRLSARRASGVPS